MSTRGRLLFILAFGHGISHWFQGAMSICLPAITAELGITYTQIGLLRSLQRVAVLLSAIGGGLATDFLRRRKIKSPHGSANECQRSNQYINPDGLHRLPPLSFKKEKNYQQVDSIKANRY
jgi:hypothetical protein